MPRSEYTLPAPKGGLLAFAVVHGLIILFGFVTIVRPWGGTATAKPIPIEILLLIGAVLSLLQFSIGRIVIRLYCLWVFVDLAVQVYNTHSTSFWQVVELIWWIYVYNCFSKTSWWYGLYHPLGIFGKRSNPAF
jgi:hypothetical protein